jgi:hypothetical protein
MQIEITGETERLVQAVLASGKFANVNEFIETMARNVQPSGSQNVSETYEAQSSCAGIAGWDDSDMDIYDNYDSQKVRH